MPASPASCAEPSWTYWPPTARSKPWLSGYLHPNGCALNGETRPYLQTHCHWSMKHAERGEGLVGAWPARIEAKTVPYQRVLWTLAAVARS